MVVTYRDQDNKTRELYSDSVLVAAGRKLNTEGLQLQKAGVEVNDRGAIQVKERLQTTVPQIFCHGGCIGGLQFTYISLDDRRIILENLYVAKHRTTEDRTHVPYSVFIDEMN